VFDGMTLGEACGIVVEGKNKWMTLIQNAAQANQPSVFTIV